ncbi:hypothetical protein [Brevundimonas sp.]|uniref:hypothetical protein n=2 Tax=unclassified Brevundimonas TaxID=2622653 RepID=UPI0028A24566|nr:hypothetical protein [Brevundimonas sp.]
MSPIDRVAMTYVPVSTRVRRSASMAAACAPEASASRLPVAVSLADIDIASENLRSGEARTRISRGRRNHRRRGLLQYPTVRPGRRGARHMVLGGRRRLLALRRLRDAGRARTSRLSRPAPPTPPLAAASSPETDGISHVLHAARSDTATRGLIRPLAGEPSVVLSVLVARPFACLTAWPSVSRSEAALSVTASTFVPAHGRIIAGLDGVVREQLDERRRAWEAWGPTLIAWIYGFHAEDRFALMAELTALSLDRRGGCPGMRRWRR